MNFHPLQSFRLAFDVSVGSMFTPPYVSEDFVLDTKLLMFFPLMVSKRTFAMFWKVVW